MNHSTPVHYGIIGLGLLGSAIGRRLLAAGHSVLGFDIDENSCERWVGWNGHLADSAGDVLSRAPHTLLSLPNSDCVRAVLDESRSALTAGHDILDTTTGSPEETMRIAEEVGRSGVRWLDTTVVGSSQHMLDGKAILLVGGSEAAYQDHTGLMEQLSQRAFYVGLSGSAARMKLVVNLVIGLNRAVLAEGLTFSEAMGFDPQTTLEIFQSSLAHSRVMDTKGEKMIQEDFTPQARLAQHLKDVDLILSASASNRLSLPLSSIHRDLLQRVVDLGDGQLDNSAIIKAFQQKPAE